MQEDDPGLLGALVWRAQAGDGDNLAAAAASGFTYNAVNECKSVRNMEAGK